MLILKRFHSLTNTYLYYLIIGGELLLKGIRNIKDYSLRTKLILVFLAILVWLASINFIQIYLFMGYVKQYNDMLETITLTNSINGVLKQKLNDEIREIAYGKVPFEDGTQYEHLKNMYLNLEKIEANDENKQFSVEITGVRETLHTTNQYIDQLGEQIQGAASADERSITYEYITILSDLIDEKVQLLLQSTLIMIEDSKNTISTHLKRDLTIYIGSFIILFIMAILFAWFISNNFVKRIRNLGQKTNKLAEGDLTIGVIPITTNNEIGDLCRSYNRMYDNLKDIIISVRKTNDLVVITSKDIHQSILENQLAGEEVAEATQTISINLHQQDQLIQQSVSTVETLFYMHNEIVKQSNQINKHSKETTQLSIEVNDQIIHFMDKVVHTFANLRPLWSNPNEQHHDFLQIKENFNRMKLLLMESNVLCLTLYNSVTQPSMTNKTEETILRIKEISDEGHQLSEGIENQILDLQHVFLSTKTKLKQNSEQIYEATQQSSSIKNQYQRILHLRNQQQEEIENMKQNIQVAFDQMLKVRHSISEIEQSSRINKEQIVGIAAMGEEQLTTIEEISDFSFKLVERIHDMERNMKKFTL